MQDGDSHTMLQYAQKGGEDERTDEAFRNGSPKTPLRVYQPLQNSGIRWLRTSIKLLSRFLEQERLTSFEFLSFWRPFTYRGAVGPPIFSTCCRSSFLHLSTD
jgi:hypothetical protein